jgi:hypothetical protein
MRQPLDRHVHEVRIAQIDRPVPVGPAHGLDQEVDLL